MKAYCKKCNRDVELLPTGYPEYGERQRYKCPYCHTQLEPKRSLLVPILFLTIVLIIILVTVLATASNFGINDQNLPKLESPNSIGSQCSCTINSSSFGNLSGSGSTGQLTYFDGVSSVKGIEYSKYDANNQKGIHYYNYDNNVQIVLNPLFKQIQMGFTSSGFYDALGLPSLPEYFMSIGLEGDYNSGNNINLTIENPTGSNDYGAFHVKVNQYNDKNISAQNYCNSTGTCKDLSQWGGSSSSVSDSPFINDSTIVYQKNTSQNILLKNDKQVGTEDFEILCAGNDSNYYLNGEPICIKWSNCDSNNCRMEFTDKAGNGYGVYMSALSADSGSFGTVSASNYYGDGSQLTKVLTSLTQNNNIKVNSTFYSRPSNRAINATIGEDCDIYNRCGLQFRTGGNSERAYTFWTTSGNDLLNINTITETVTVNGYLVPAFFRIQAYSHPSSDYIISADGATATVGHYNAAPAADGRDVFYIWNRGVSDTGNPIWLKSTYGGYFMINPDMELKNNRIAMGGMTNANKTLDINSNIGQNLRLIRGATNKSIENYTDFTLDAKGGLAITSYANNITLNGQVTLTNASSYVGRVMCYATTGSLGHCTDATNSTGGCTCVLN